MNLLIVTGMSGAGKSQTSGILEDKGYKCIDNMPVSLIPHLWQLYENTATETQNIALIIDVRGETDFAPMLREVDNLKTRGFGTKILFLDCSNDTLVRRFKETRHLHPLQIGGRPLIEAIEKERVLLEPVKRAADKVLDTSTFELKNLKREVSIFLDGASSDVSGGFIVRCVSFGFKYGVPIDADMMFDVRCFKNPFYIDELKPLTGLDKRVRDYVLSTSEGAEFAEKLYDMVDFLVPLYKEEGKNALTIAIGCTGGKHRSITYAELLATHLQSVGISAVAFHRDIEM